MKLEISRYRSQEIFKMLHPFFPHTYYGCMPRRAKEDGTIEYAFPFFDKASKNAYTFLFAKFSKDSLLLELTIEGQYLASFPGGELILWNKIGDREIPGFDPGIYSDTIEAIWKKLSKLI